MARLLVVGVLVAAVAGGGTAYLLTRDGGAEGPGPAEPAEGNGEEATEEEPPPLAEARVEGTFAGKGLYGAELTFGARCPSGPCDLTATGRRPEFLLAQPEGKEFLVLGARTRGGPILYVSKKPAIPVRLDFAFDGRTYRSRLRFQQDCSIEGFEVPVSIALELEVTRAEMLDGEWRATELRATSRLRSGRRVFDASNTTYPGFVEFHFTCLAVRDVNTGAIALEGGSVGSD